MPAPTPRPAPAPKQAPAPRAQREEVLPRPGRREEVLPRPARVTPSPPRDGWFEDAWDTVFANDSPISSVDYRSPAPAEDEEEAAYNTWEGFFASTEQADAWASDPEEPTPTPTPTPKPTPAPKPAPVRAPPAPVPAQVIAPVPVPWFVRMREGFEFCIMCNRWINDDTHFAGRRHASRLANEQWWRDYLENGGSDESG